MNIATKGVTESGSLFDHLANMLEEGAWDVMSDLPYECAGR
ncbi:hypothetical protein CEV32_4463 [Brucella rhizosphaerae]|uniref:Uncharacterized protein n=1 Tax=Brucella rhizosphaerae TaxID=571254 RepID=A0A256FMZ2_9HYPH|nr:hypothetical protein CEV32_4463 [Brucella rhizosphaerae]